MKKLTSPEHGPSTMRSQQVDDDPDLMKLKGEINERDFEAWSAYRLSLSMSEQKEQVMALRNLRMTRKFILDDASKYSDKPLSELETSNYLRTMSDQVSIVEHFTFETWREARKIRLAIRVIIGMLASIFCILVFLLFANAH